jgi:hypothetical protein
LPLANAVMGVLIEWNLHAVLIGSAMIIVVVSAIVACHPDAVKLAPLPDDEDQPFQTEGGKGPIEDV